MTKLKCILLVDDDEATNYYHQIIINSIGIAENIQVATDGQEALDYLERCSGPGEDNVDYPRPDLIFLDINMPGMNGLEFLERYDRLPASQKGCLLIVMLTTSLLERDRTTSESYEGVVGFLDKPLTKENLSRLVREHFSERFATAPSH